VVRALNQGLSDKEGEGDRRPTAESGSKNHQRAKESPLLALSQRSALLIEALDLRDKTAVYARTGTPAR